LNVRRLSAFVRAEISYSLLRFVYTTHVDIFCDGLCNEDVVRTRLVADFTTEVPSRFVVLDGFFRHFVLVVICLHREKHFNFLRNKYLDSHLKKMVFNGCNVFIDFQRYIISTGGVISKGEI